MTVTAAEKEISQQKGKETKKGKERESKKETKKGKK
jgi:hypothetical protein